MLTPVMLTLVTVVLVLLLLVGEALHHRAMVWVFKPLASAGFVATAVAGGAWDTSVGQCMTAALLLSAAGDVLLIPKDRRAFLAGLVAFLLGHVLFAVAFAVRGASGQWTALAATVMLVPAAVVGRWLLPRVEGKLKRPVLAYMTVISAMVALAVGSVVQLGGVALLVAAVAFYLSDLSVARDRFVAPGFINRAWGLPLYYGAQILFALNVHT